MGKYPNMQEIIHIGFIGKTPLLLKKEEDTFTWYRGSTPTHVSAKTIEEAISKARKEWKNEYFRTAQCGYRFTLPERDEHGSPALFYQMKASYTSPNGIYLDEELGHSCIVKNASDEARSFLHE